MKADELLLWLSARRQGSWEQFKGAVESLHLPDDPSGEGEMAGGEEERGGGLPIYQELRLNLSNLAHVEFFAGGYDGGWRVAPPVLAAQQGGNGWTAVLCGARSTALLALLRKVADGMAAIETEEHAASPLLYRLRASDISSLEHITKETGLALQREATLAILGSIPPVSDRLFLRPAPLRMGKDWRVDRFSVASLRWEQSSRDEAAGAREGLFRFQLFYEWLYFFRRRGETYEVSGQVAKYVLLKRHRRSILRYSEEGETLSLPASCRPPQMIDRALVLCSGVLPSFEPKDTTLTYSGVPLLAARLASQLLCQGI